MTTTNPHDAVNQVIRRAKKVEKEIDSAIGIITKNYDLIPRRQLREYKVFVDERSKPVYVSEIEHPIEFNRRGKWISVREI